MIFIWPLELSCAIASGIISRVEKRIATRHLIKRLDTKQLEPVPSNVTMAHGAEMMKKYGRDGEI